MSTYKQLLEVVDCFNLGKIKELTPNLGVALEELFLDEETEETDDGVSVAEDLRSIVRRHAELESFLEIYEDGVAYLYSKIPNPQGGTVYLGNKKIDLNHL